MVNFLSSPIFTEPRFRGKILQSNLSEFAIFRSRIIGSEKKNSSPWLINSYMPNESEVAFFLSHIQILTYILFLWVEFEVFFGLCAFLTKKLS